MNKLKQIVIADPDIDYIKSYEEEFISLFCGRASIQFITEREFLENYFRVHREIDALIISEKFLGNYLNEHNVRSLMLLNNKTGYSSDGEISSPGILNYQNKHKIFDFVEKVLESEIEPEKSPDISPERKEKTTKIISVYSPVGGSGKSLVALALAKKLKKLGESAVVIGCDDIQSFGAFLDTRYTAGSDLAAKLCDFSEDTYWLVLKNIYQSDFSCLLPFDMPLSALNIGSEQIISLVNLLKEKKDFSNIILDLGSSLERGMQTLISISDICIFVTESRVTSCRMMEKFQMNMDFLNIKKSYTVANQYRSDGLRLDTEKIFGSFSKYDTIDEAMEDPVFYRLAIEVAGL